MMIQYNNKLMMASIFTMSILLGSISAYAEYNQKQNRIDDRDISSSSEQNQSNNSSKENSSDRKNQNADNDNSKHNKDNTSTQIGSANITYEMLAKKIVGMDVVNNEDEELGTIDNLALNKDGKVTYAIVSVGGFLGVGDKLVAVSFEKLRMTKSKDEIIIDATKQQLEQAAEFQYMQ